MGLIWTSWTRRLPSDGGSQSACTLDPGRPYRLEVVSARTRQRENSPPPLPLFPGQLRGEQVHGFGLVEPSSSTFCGTPEMIRYRVCFGVGSGGGSGLREGGPGCQDRELHRDASCSRSGQPSDRRRTYFGSCLRRAISVLPVTTDGGRSTSLPCFFRLVRRRRASGGQQLPFNMSCRADGWTYMSSIPLRIGWSQM